MRDDLIQAGKFWVWMVCFSTCFFASFGSAHESQIVGKKAAKTKMSQASNVQGAMSSPQDRVFLKGRTRSVFLSVDNDNEIDSTSSVSQ